MPGAHEGQKRASDCRVGAGALTGTLGRVTIVLNHKYPFLLPLVLFHEPTLTLKLRRAQYFVEHLLCTLCSRL